MVLCDQHSGVCEVVKGLKDDAKENWNVMRTRLAARTFFWAMGIMAVVIGALFGYGIAMGRDQAMTAQCVAVIQADIRHMQGTMNRIERAVNGAAMVPGPGRPDG